MSEKQNAVTAEKVISVSAAKRPEFQRRLMEETIPWKVYFIPRFKILCKIEPDKFQLTVNSANWFTTDSRWPILTGVYETKGDVLEIALSGTKPHFLRQFSYLWFGLVWFASLAPYVLFIFGVGEWGSAGAIGPLLAGCVMTGFGFFIFQAQKVGYEEKLNEMRRLVEKIASEVNS